MNTVFIWLQRLIDNATLPFDMFDGGDVVLHMDRFGKIYSGGK